MPNSITTGFRENPKIVRYGFLECFLFANAKFCRTGLRRDAVVGVAKSRTVGARGRDRLVGGKTRDWRRGTANPATEAMLRVPGA